MMLLSSWSPTRALASTSWLTRAKMTSSCPRGSYCPITSLLPAPSGKSQWSSDCSRQVASAVLGGWILVCGFVSMHEAVEGVSVREQACSHCGSVPGHQRRRVRSATFLSHGPSPAWFSRTSPLDAVVLPAWTGWSRHGDSGCPCSAEDTVLITFNEYLSHCAARVTNGLLLHPLSVLWVSCLP